MIVAKKSTKYIGIALGVILSLFIATNSAQAFSFDWFTNLFKGAPETTEQLPTFGKTVAFPEDGGTGTSTKPTTNSILIGNANGRYDVKVLTAGSNITITNSGSTVTIASTGGGSGGADFPNNQSWGNATSTTLGFLNGFLSTASSTINASTTITGVLTASGGIFGNLTGNVTGSATDLNCTDCIGSTEIDSTIAIAARNLTIAGTANQITSSAGAQDLSADRTWTLSLPSALILPGTLLGTGSSTLTNLTSIYSTSTNATSTNIFTQALTVDNNGAGDAVVAFGPSGSEWTVGYDATDGSFGIEDGTTLGTNNLTISTTGFGTTTLTGLNINGSATSTSNVGWNITTGCYAVNGTCISGSGSSASSTLLADNNTFSGSNQFSATTSMKALNFSLAGDVSASQSTGGVLNINRGTSLGPALIAYTNAGTGGGRLGSFKCDNTALDTQCLNVDSDSTLETTLNVLGSPAGKGVIKVGSNGVGDADGSLLSLDASLASYLGQSTFIKCGTSAICGQWRTSGNSQRITIDNELRIGLGTTTPFTQFQVASTTANGGFKPQIAITDTAAGTNLKHWTLSSQGGNFYIASSTDAYATSTTASISISGSTNTVTFGNSLATCIALTGSADLCDGGDATGAGGSFPFTTETNYGDTANSTSTQIWFKDSPISFTASSTAYIDTLVVSTTTATSTVLGDLRIGNITGNDNQLRIQVGRNYNTSSSVGGAVNITNTSNNGPGLVVYSNQASSGGNLVNFRCDNATFAHDCTRIDHDGTGDGLAIVATAAASNALSISNTGVGHTFNSAYTGTTANMGAGNFTSTNVLGSTLQVSGDADSLGLVKFTHSGNGDTDASILSMAASDVTYAGQGIFLDMETTATTQKLLNLRADGTEELVLTPLGAGIGTSTPSVQLQIASSTGSQIRLSSADSTSVRWDFRAVGSTFYLATSSPSTLATSTTPVFTVDSTNTVTFGNSLATCIALTGSSGLCDGSDASGGGGSSDSKFSTTTSALNPNAIYVNGGDNTLVGIGTSTPMYQLTVASTTGPQLSLSAGAGVLQWTMRNAGGNLYLATTTVAGTATTSTSALTIIGSSGNVGIGTTTPGFPLEVDGTLMIQGLPGATNSNFRIRSGDYVGDWSHTVEHTTGRFTLYDQANNKNILYVTANGANNTIFTGLNGTIGFLTASPQAQLHLWNPFTTTLYDPIKIGLNTSEGYQLLLQTAQNANASSTGIGFTVTTTNDNTGGAIVFQRTGGNSMGEMMFYTKQSATSGVAPVEVMRLADDGNTGFATSSPYARVSIAGVSTSNVLLGLDAVSGATADLVQWNIASTTKLTFNSSGRLGIGTTTPWGVLSVSDSSYAYDRPMFAVSTSTNGTGFIMGAFGTSTTLSLGSSPLTLGVDLDSGARLGIGTYNQYGYGGLLDHLTVRGRINTEGWNTVQCDKDGSAGLSGDTSNVCGSFQLQEDTAGTWLSVAANGYGYNSVQTDTGSANSGMGFFAAGSSGGTAFMVPATSTPVMEISARIQTPAANLSDSKYIIGFTNLGITGTTFETEPTIGCYFMATTTANWQAMCRTAAGSNATQVDTGVASSTSVTATGGWRRFRIEMDNDNAVFYIQQTESSAMAVVANISTNYPSTTALHAGAHNSVITALTTAMNLNIMHFRVWWRDMLPSS